MSEIIRIMKTIAKPRARREDFSLDEMTSLLIINLLNGIIKYPIHGPESNARPCNCKDIP
jgi:hypothetical protein